MPDSTYFGNANPDWYQQNTGYNTLQHLGDERTNALAQMYGYKPEKTDPIASPAGNVPVQNLLTSPTGVQHNAGLFQFLRSSPSYQGNFNNMLNDMNNYKFNPQQATGFDAATQSYSGPVFGGTESYQPIRPPQGQNGGAMFQGFGNGQGGAGYGTQTPSIQPTASPGMGGGGGGSTSLNGNINSQALMQLLSRLQPQVQSQNSLYRSGQISPQLNRSFYPQFR